MTPPRQARLAFAGAAALVLVVGLLGAFVHYGGPAELVAQGLRLVHDDLQQTRRSTSTSASSPSRGATAPSSGTPPGTTTRRIGCSAPAPGRTSGTGTSIARIQHKVRDAHNLYLEVLAETRPARSPAPHPRPRHAARCRVPGARPPARPARARRVRRVPRPRGRRLGLGDERGHAGGARLRGRGARTAAGSASTSDPLAEAASCRRGSVAPARGRWPSSESWARAHWLRATAP